MKLERMHHKPEQYYYLSLEDSKLYDQFKDSKDEKDVIICSLIMDKAEASRGNHCASSY